ncbi:hypothetical protein F7725_018745 [Dissostichus mawsoni]|uniref:adenylate cyclase n=1 Tax=Dissostichus mawsoni TaxID=36200 RepID=A0A7J5XV67_DISMA|nr:hypothetical protein F7725_018745 [Dissostichus mawsoni]
MYSNDTNPTFLQVEHRSPQYQYRPRNTVDGAKMRASVRMTRYLESWGAAKPFANLHHRDSMTNENGKINTANKSQKKRFEEELNERMIRTFDGINSQKQWLKSEDIQRISLFFHNKSLEKEHCSKSSSTSWMWLLRSSVIIANKPWPRITLTMTTTALILIMAVFNMYLIYSCILGLISCSVFLRINYELKMIIMLTAVVVYNVIILQTHASLLDEYSRFLYKTESLDRPGVLKDLKTMGSISLFIFFITLLVLARQVRLSVENKFKKECEEIETMENLNRVLLENVLPAHVAEHFLARNWKNEDLYHQSYDLVCVMFASIPDFKEFYTESDVNKEGLECLRLLNEIIADFDELLSNPNSVALKRSRLLAGINHGPVIAGVIGAQKPQYDIWGNTVNVASRMDSTGVLGKIQVNGGDDRILLTLGYMCSCRGIINVKGKESSRPTLCTQR